MSATIDAKIRSAIRHHRERAAAFGLTIDYSSSHLRELVVQALGAPCTYCGVPIVETTYSIDHDVPTSRRGSFRLDNCVVCCDRCNTIKGALTGDEYRLLVALFREIHPDAEADLRRRLMASGGRWGRDKKKGKS